MHSWLLICGSLPALYAMMALAFANIPGKTDPTSYWMRDQTYVCSWKKQQKLKVAAFFKNSPNSPRSRNFFIFFQFLRLYWEEQVCQNWKQLVSWFRFYLTFCEICLLFIWLKGLFVWLKRPVLRYTDVFIWEWRRHSLYHGYAWKPERSDWCTFWLPMTLRLFAIVNKLT